MYEARTDDIVEKRMLGTLGMKDQPLVGQILSPADTTRKRALAPTANFLAIDRGDIVYCAKELTRQLATPTTTDLEEVVGLDRYLKKKTDARFDCGTNFKKRRVNLKRNQTQIGQVAEEHAQAKASAWVDVPTARVFPAWTKESNACASFCANSWICARRATDRDPATSCCGS